MKKLAMLLVPMAFLSFVAMAQGGVVFFNYNQTSDNWDAWNNTSPLPEMLESFSTNSNPLGQWELTQITLRAYGGGILGGGSSPATVTIYADDGGNPGTAVSSASWDIDIDTGMGEDFSFSAMGVALDAGEAYWLGLEATGNNAVGWNQTTAGSHVFEIAGNPIPEPATMSLLAIGGLAALIRRRRRK